jgi:hypothetical protein
MRRALGLLFPLAIAASLVAGIAGGLLRAGVPWPAAAPGPWLGRAAAFHAFLMVGAFMGSVIGLERAVAVKRPFAFVAPALSAAAGVFAISGGARAEFAPWIAVLAAATFVLVNVVVVRRQPAAHTTLLLVGAVAWLVGDLAFAASRAAAAVPWWLAFLVLTIAAERLEMTRLMRRRRGAGAALALILASLLAGAAAFMVDVRVGEVLYGVSLVALSAWLLAFDIARRTIRAHGLPRYMAACLLLGYAWLGLSGLAWIGLAAGLAVRDVALHALALGFVFSMMLGHAPVILPALARIKLRFGVAWYVPLALLHATLLLRLAGGLDDAHRRALGAAGNAIALLAFVVTVAGAAIAWRRAHGPKRPSRPTPNLVP